MNKNGKLVVLEGIDGSGKGTQAKLLRERLAREGFETEAISFPQYGKKSAGLIEEYLNGTYEDVNPYAASLFYAVDRFDASIEIRKLLDEGHIVILDRYVDSNAGHQGAKISDRSARGQFLKWLYDTEYRILGVPKPDIVLILTIDPATAQLNVGKKDARKYLKHGKTHDILEADKTHLENAQDSYLWLAKKHPENHILINCMKKRKLMPPEKIHEKIWSAIAPIINMTNNKV
ncbi:MAG: dTMP kinase [Candidatus Sungbacteria bacterium GWC2_49_10]|nr:MAG: dTMP kinase [Candidatus Sungbacteria bacterium GWC2_49_10]